MSYCNPAALQYISGSALIQIILEEHFMIKLGEKIKSLRKQKNISQEAFANYLGVSFQAVSKWENGVSHS